MVEKTYLGQLLDGWMAEAEAKLTMSPEAEAVTFADLLPEPEEPADGEETLTEGEAAPEEGTSSEEAAPAENAADKAE